MWRSKNNKQTEEKTRGRRDKKGEASINCAVEGRGGRCQQELEMKRFWDGKAPPVS